MSTKKKHREKERERQRRRKLSQKRQKFEIFPQSEDWVWVVGVICFSLLLWSFVAPLVGLFTPLFFYIVSRWYDPSDTFTFRYFVGAECIILSVGSLISIFLMS